MVSATSARRNTLRASKVYVTACLCLFIAWVLESHQQSFEKNESQDFIERIDIEGYRRLELATIRAHFLSRPGDLYSAEVVQRDAQTLRDTGYFEEVRLLVEDSPDRQNGKIVEFVLREKPVIRRLEYRGVKSITRADILNAFKYQQVGLGRGVVRRHKAETRQDRYRRTTLGARTPICDRKAHVRKNCLLK